LSLLRSCEKRLLLVIAMVACACSSSSEDGDYSGVAYPSQGPSFEPAGRRLGYVANRNSDTVSVLDLDAMTLLGTVPVGRDPVDIDGPKHVVVDAADGLAYVVLSYPFSIPSPHAMTTQAPRSGYVEALDLSDLSIAGDLRVDANAGDVAFSPASGKLAVSHYDLPRALLGDLDARRANVVFVDPASAIATGEATANRVLVCAAPANIAFNADGSRVFVACTGEDSVVVVDSESQAVLSRVPAGNLAVNKPYALVGDSIRQRVLVSNQVAATVSVFDMSDTPNVVSTLSVPGTPFFATWLSDSTVAVPFQAPNGVALFDVTSGELTLQVQYSDADCLNPAELSTTSDSRLRLVCSGDQYNPGAVVELDPVTLALLSSVAVGIYPERMSSFEP
jgi:YVTN family beta-propeller protein